MPRFIADENFEFPVLEQLRLRNPDWDILSALDAGLRSMPDTTILAWAAQERRILLTHDVKTMVPAAYERIGASVPMPGVMYVPARLDPGRAVTGIEVAMRRTREEDWEGKVVYLSLR